MVAIPPVLPLCEDVCMDHLMQQHILRSMQAVAVGKASEIDTSNSSSTQGMNCGQEPVSH